MKTSPIKIYFLLIFFLFLTTALAYVHLGVFIDIVALSIALLKALLFVIFFMELGAARKPTLLFALAGFVWLGLLLTLTMSDYLTRGALFIYGK